MSSFGTTDAELRSFMGMDAINSAINPFAWETVMKQDILAFFSNPDATICGQSLAKALAITGCDTWLLTVDPNTARIAEWEPNGNDMTVQALRPTDGDGKLRFNVGDMAALLKSGREITLEAVLATPGLFAAFCFSVAKNVDVFNVFVVWFSGLTENQRANLMLAPEEIRALCLHIVWILANCGGKHTLSAVDFDPVVKAVLADGAQHEFPTLDIIAKLVETGSFTGLAEISTYAAGYVEVWRARSDTTAIYTDMDGTKFQQFSRLVIA